MSDVAFQRWQAPPVADPRGDGAPPGAGLALTAARLAEIEAQAREQGFATGLAEGRAQGVDEVRRQAERLAALLDAVASADDVLGDALAEQLGVLVTTAVRQFVRRELHHQPGEVVRVLRECLGVLPAADSRISVHLHPQDAELIRSALASESFERAWRVVEDPTLDRGGVRLETDTSSVDATVETRLNALLARLLGESRRNRADD
jgi:flagellar assembly protein FliH